MTFTPELPTEPGAYFGRETGVTDSHFLCEVVRTDKDGSLGLTIQGEEPRPLEVYAGFEFNGPLVSADEVAELRQEIALLKSKMAIDEADKNLMMDADRKELSTLKADNARLTAEAARLREEVGKAWHEGVKNFVDTFNTGFTYGYDQSRAKRVAEGEFPQ